MEKDLKVQVKVGPTEDGEVRELPPYFLAPGGPAEEAGWTDDPTMGRAVLLPDERGNGAYEVCNPLPIAPPIGWEPTPPIDQLIADRVRVAMDKYREEDEIDDIVDAEDFDIPDELPLLETMYEVIGMEAEVPTLKPPTAKERAAAQAEYEELVEFERRLRKVRAREEWGKRAQEARDLYGIDPKEVDDALLSQTSDSPPNARRDRSPGGRSKESSSGE